MITLGIKIIQDLTGDSSKKDLRKSFNELKKIDAHCHYNTDKLTLAKAANNDNMHLFTINTDYPAFPDMESQYQIAQKVKSQAKLDFVCSFADKGFAQDPQAFCKSAIERIKNCIANGAKGVKVWKNIGMELKDKDGNLVYIDDQRLAPIFQYISDNQIRLIGHQGEPKNCWLPLDQMTTLSDRAYFSEHPEYHSYKLKDVPSYEDQINHRNGLLEKFPKLKFCGAHLGSLEWSIDEISKTLDRFPNMVMDTAERICHLQYQAANRYDDVRNFVLKYQDRLLYGTDVIDEGDNAEIYKQYIDVAMNEWEFMTTTNTMRSSRIEKSFKGLGLPKDVIKKIYFENAKKFWQLKV